MIPFGGLIQAISGSNPGFGEKSANIGKGVHGMSDSDDAILLSDDDARTFLAWVHKAMGSDATVDSEGESGFGPENIELGSNLPTLDQLQTLIAGAMNQASAGQTDSQTLNDENLDGGYIPLPQGIINAIVAHHEGSNLADRPPEEALPDLMKMMAVNENASTGGQKQPVANEQLSQTPVSGGSTQTVQANTSQIMENQSGVAMKEAAPAETIAKEGALSLFKPVGPGEDEGKTNPGRFIQEQSPSGLGSSEKSVAPPTPSSPSNAGQTKDPEFMATVQSDQKTASSEDDTANFRGKDKHNTAQRISLADVSEDELQKGQSSDSAKSTIPEQVKSHPSFQDTAKPMPGEATANVAAKHSAGQAAALARTEDAAVKSFQTTVMDQIVDKAAMRSIHGRSEIQIRLKPEFLGNVQMNIAADKEQLVVRIMTDRPAVKEIIETHLHHLKTELQSQGMTIDKFEILVNPDANQQHSRDQFAQMFKHHFSQNGRQQSHGRDPETSNREDGSRSDDERPNREGVNYFA